MPPNSAGNWVLYVRYQKGCHGSAFGCELGLIVDGRGSTNTNRLTLSFPITALTPWQATSTVTWRTTDHWQASTHVVNVQNRSFTLTPEVVLAWVSPTGSRNFSEREDQKQL